MLTFEEVKNNAAIRTYIQRADESLIALGFTEHSFAHVTMVAENAAYILETLGYPARTVEIARIAAFLGQGEADFIAHEAELAPDRKGLMLKSRPDGACVYLTDDNLCRINPVKPDKCRSFPFDWVNPDSNEVCPGLKAANR